MAGPIRCLHDLAQQGFDVRVECPHCGYGCTMPIGAVRVLFHQLRRSEDWADAHRRWRCSSCGRRVAQAKLTTFPAPAPEAVQLLRQAVAGAYIGRLDIEALRAAAARLEPWVGRPHLDAYLQAVEDAGAGRDEQGTLIRERLRAIERDLYPDHEPAMRRIERRFGKRHALPE